MLFFYSSDFLILLVSPSTFIISDENKSVFYRKTLSVCLSIGLFRTLRRSLLEVIYMRKDYILSKQMLDIYRSLAVSVFPYCPIGWALLSISIVV